MTPKIVGVIFSRADLGRALRMRKPPNLFEVRLDRFANNLTEVRAAIPRLPAPLIITARHPVEGGTNNLSVTKRRALLTEFVPHARYVDVELRSVLPLRPVLQTAAKNNVGTIISFHDFETMPRPAQLERVVAQGYLLGAAFVKVAVRTDTKIQLDRLLDFFEQHRVHRETVTMGIGKFGRAARVELARRGCPLNYGHLGTAAAPGQLSIEELRQIIGHKS